MFNFLFGKEKIIKKIKLCSKCNYYDKYHNYCKNEVSHKQDLNGIYKNTRLIQDTLNKDNDCPNFKGKLIPLLKNHIYYFNVYGYTELYKEKVVFFNGSYMYFGNYASYDLFIKFVKFYPNLKKNSGEYELKRAIELTNDILRDIERSIKGYYFSNSIRYDYKESKEFKYYLNRIMLARELTDSDDIDKLKEINNLISCIPDTLKKIEAEYNNAFDLNDEIQGLLI